MAAVLGSHVQKKSSEEQPTTTHGPVDWKEAMRSVDGDRELLADVVDAYLTESPMLLKRLREAVESAVAEQVERAAHTLKGPSRSLGGTRAFQCCWQLEQMGREGDLAKASEVLVTLEREMERLCEALQEFAATRRFPGEDG